MQRINVPGSTEWSQNIELQCISSYDGLTISYYNREEDTYWLIKCWCIVVYKIINKEFSTQEYSKNLPIEGSFFEILGSPWIDVFVHHDRIMSKCRHCIFRFRDHTIEVIAQEYIYEQLKQKPVIKYEWEILKKDVP